jgi:hypothetical protein
MREAHTIYIYLLDEGVDVWRPVSAEHIGQDRYRIVSVNDDPDDEHWEFECGEVVRCKERKLDGGMRMVAYSKVE